MSKYQYWNGERRYYRGIPIWYDLAGQEPGPCHWYIETCTTISGCGPTKNPVSTCRIAKVYFQTLSAAKRYIDDF